MIIEIGDVYLMYTDFFPKPSHRHIVQLASVLHAGKNLSRKR